MEITDDDISEDMESFRVLLELDPFELQEGIQVNPNVTEICILDTDGNILNSSCVGMY